MQVEDYLELDDPDGIKIRGHRIWMNDLLMAHLYNWMGAEGLLERFPTLNREKIYAALLYFEQHREELTRKLEEDIERQERNYTEHAAEYERKRAELVRRRDGHQKAAS